MSAPDYIKRRRAPDSKWPLSVTKAKPGIGTISGQDQWLFIIK